MYGLLTFGAIGDFITALTGTGGLTSENLWAQITPVALFIASMVIFAFGYRVVRRLVSGASKGKGKI